ncbi:endonuclease domain-containing protein [Microbacterium kunmingense]|uniref:endonuclease domain-containing protein n=1 Tax=Microbacterium kunmingense TaxID=2915939 RepID=UPI003D75E5A4
MRRIILPPQVYLHRATLLETGWRPDTLRRAIAEQGLQLLRRTWVATPDLDPDLRHAATLGGVVTCVSATDAFGLWRPDGANRPHIRLPPHSSSVSAGVRFHRQQAVTLAPARELVDAIENVLAAVATCLPLADALVVWESALQRGVVTPAHLRAVAWRTTAARQLADIAGALSDSGLETFFVHGMRRVGVSVLQRVLIGGQPVDGLIGDRLVIQIDGFAHHSDAAQRRKDIRHDRLLRSLGYTVLRFDYVDVVHSWPRVQAEVLRAIAQGLHLAPRGARA